jgi:hypothetical protein
MAYYVGAGAQMQIGKESIYGTPVAYTKTVNFLSESIKLAVERKSEDSLVASKAIVGSDIMSKKVAGDFSVILKPEEAGILLAWALGLEAANPTLEVAGSYIHTLTLQAAAGALPSYTMVIDRRAAVKQYAGLKVDSFKLEAKAQDYLRATVGVKGQDEAAGTVNGGLTASSKRAFKFVNGTLTVDGSSFANITSVTLTIANKLTEVENTLTTGLLMPEPIQGTREISVSIEALYDAAAESFRESKYKAGALANVVMQFESPDLIVAGKTFRINIAMPNVDISQADVNVGGRDTIKMSIQGTALAIGATEPITVLTYDGNNAKLA